MYTERDSKVVIIQEKCNNSLDEKTITSANT